MKTRTGKVLMVLLPLLVALVIGWTCLALADHTTTASFQTPADAGRKVQWIKVAIDNDWPDIDLDDATFTLPYYSGLVTRIVADSTGTDTAWSLILKDPVSATIFTKTDMNSEDEPEGFMVFGDDTGDDPHAGVPVWGQMALDIDDVARQGEVQTCTAEADADAGTYQITIDGANTTTMAFDDANTDIETALEALSNIGSGNITSVVSDLSAGNATPIVITFDSNVGNVPSAVFADVVDTNSGDVTVVETTEGGNLLTALTLYIFLEQ